MIGATALLVWAGSARANPPPEGMLVSFAHPLIMCDKAEQLKDLVAAQRTSEEAFGAKAKELIADTKVCTPAQIINVVVGDSEDVGNLKWGDIEEHVWIIHFGDSKSEHWALYEELVAIKHDTAI